MTLHVGTLREIDLKPVDVASMPAKALDAQPLRQAIHRAPNWGAYLARPIRLADGERVLERLWDAADVLHCKASGSAESHRSETALMVAAATGARADISAATDHLEIYLRAHALM